MHPHFVDEKTGSERGRKGNCTRSQSQKVCRQDRHCGARTSGARHRGEDTDNIGTEALRKVQLFKGLQRSFQKGWRERDRGEWALWAENSRSFTMASMQAQWQRGERRREKGKEPHRKSCRL